MCSRQTGSFGHKVTLKMLANHANSADAKSRAPDLLRSVLPLYGTLHIASFATIANQIYQSTLLATEDSILEPP